MCLRYLLTVCHYFEERAGNIELTSFCSLFLCLLLCLIFGWKVKVKVLVGQLCLTLSDPMSCNLPGSSVHGISQATVLEWIAISFSRGPFQPRDRTQVSHIVDRCLTVLERCISTLPS